MISVSEESNMNTINELNTLGFFEASYTEVSPRSQAEDFLFNGPQVETLINIGMMKVFVARDNGLLPVGYHIILATPIDMFTGNASASTVSQYIHPQYRKGRTFLMLTREVEHWCKENGMKALVTTVPPTLDITRIGYTLVNHEYVKLFNYLLTHTLSTDYIKHVMHNVLLLLPKTRFV